MVSRASAEALLAEHIYRQENARMILDVAEFRLNAGELLAIVGPNGAGKSTLLRALAGLQTPAQPRNERALAGRETEKPRQTIHILGDLLATLPRNEVAKRLAYLPQRAASAVDFSVREVVAMGRSPYRAGWQTHTEDDRAIVLDALETWELTPLADRTVDSLSGGETQRVSLARIFAQRTPIVLLDEPSSALDLKQTRSLFERLLHEVRERNTACAVVIHDLVTAARFATRILLLHEGKEIANGAPEEVLTSGNMQRVFGVDDFR
jgi:iron complex transport system ATP-binding protein